MKIFKNKEQAMIFIAKEIITSKQAMEAFEFTISMILKEHKRPIGFKQKSAPQSEFEEFRQRIDAVFEKIKI